MTFAQALHQLFADKVFDANWLVLGVDFILGLVAAFSTSTFRLTYLANFARNDLSKIIAWSVVYVAAKAGDIGGFTPSVGVGGANVDLTTIAQGIGLIVLAAIGGSILKSLADLGLNLPSAVAGPAPPVVYRADRD